MFEKLKNYDIPRKSILHTNDESGSDIPMESCGNGNEELPNTPVDGFIETMCKD